MNISPFSQQDLVDQYLTAYNAFDIEGMLALLSPSVRFENYSGGALTAMADGIDEFRKLAEHAKTLFAEREQRLTALQLNDGVLTAQIAYRGRLAADIPGGPAAGTVLDLNGESEFHFQGDRIARIIDRS